MTPRPREIIQVHSHPLAPLPTDEPPVLRSMPGLRAVLFDIYGTLVISASGEVGLAEKRLQSRAFASALAAAGLGWKGGGEPDAGRLRECILQEHERARCKGVKHPEVDIVAVWRETLRLLSGEGRLDGDLSETVLRRVAVEYEVRANPVWPMPGLVECLGGLRRAGLRLGVVSNAQFFTPELFPALVGRTLEELGVEPGLQFYSFRHGRAKPGRFLYELARQALAADGVPADAILYVGNDMLNDVAAARSAGFRTAWFVGDARSLRRRESDPRVHGVRPDIVITHLNSLRDWIAASYDAESA